MIKLKLLLTLACIALFAGAAPRAQAQQTSPIVEPSLTTPPATRAGRIEIHPRPLLYRRCVDWYELQHRPSGTVLYPQMRCWWVRG